MRFEVSAAVLLKIQVDLDANAVSAGRRIVVLPFSVSGSPNFLGLPRNSCTYFQIDLA